MLNAKAVLADEAFPRDSPRPGWAKALRRRQKPAVGKEFVTPI
jgi:hypothetical protein